MNFIKLIKSTITVGLITLAFVSCGKSNSVEEEILHADAEFSIPIQDTMQSEIAFNNTPVFSDAYLNVMVDAEMATLDPQLAFDNTSFEVIANFTDGLMQMGENSEPIPAIAEYYEVSNDGLLYTFFLREDAYWSNGTPVTADDFVFAWQRAVDPDVGSEYAYMLSDIAQIYNASKIVEGDADVEKLGVLAVDDYTLQVELNVPVTFFDSLMYFPTFYPVNREFFEQVGSKNYATSPSTTLSNGAFILEDYEPAALSFSFAKNYDYWDTNSVKLAGINYQVIKDSQQALMSYQNGDLDIATISGDQVSLVSGDPELQTVSTGYLWFLTLNIDDLYYLDNQNLRLAISNAINRDTLTREVLRDGSIPTFTPVAPKFAYSDEGEDFSYNQARYAEVCAYDPSKAQEYLELAKEELKQTNFTFELLVEDTTEAQNVAVVLKEQIETALIGTTVEIEVTSKQQRVEDIQSGDFEISLTRWGPDYADPMTFLGLWVTNNENNYGLWSNKEYDVIIAECTTGEHIYDPESRWLALKDAEAIIMNEAVIVPLYTKSNATLVRANITGVNFNSIALNRSYKSTTKM